MQRLGVQFLLTNDDGIDATGLSTLAPIAAQLGSVLVVAPDRHLSGCGHQVTVERPLRLQRRKEARFALDGTPADCVRIGLHLQEQKIDWVLSGINHGGNLGIDTYMSGTVAAAREAAISGIPAIAFSQYRNGSGDIDWIQASEMVHRVLDLLMQRPLPPGLFWNVNLPDLRNGSGQEPRLVDCPVDPNPLSFGFRMDDDQFSYEGVYQDRIRHPGSDIDCCFGGDIAISQLGIELKTVPES